MIKITEKNVLIEKFQAREHVYLIKGCEDFGENHRNTFVYFKGDREYYCDFYECFHILKIRLNCFI